MFRKILIPLDGSAFAEKVFAILPRFLEPQQTSLLLVNVLDYREHALSMYEPTPLPLLSEARTACEAYLKKISASLTQQGYSIESKVEEGDIAEKVLILAQSSGCEAIAMMTHGRSGISRFALGSIAERVLQTSTLPVLLMREQAETTNPKLRRILVPLDGSPLAEQALPVAKQLAHETGAALRLIQIVSPYDIEHSFTRLPTPKQVDQAYQRWFTLVSSYLGRVAESVQREQIGCDTQVELGDPGHHIVGAATRADVDVVIMSTHGRSGLSRWVYGSVANQVIHGAPCPVLIVRSQVLQ